MAEQHTINKMNEIDKDVLQGTVSDIHIEELESEIEGDLDINGYLELC
jgi:type II secretory ATPase GspE/PulE/Tfp pilus assembly ATPase PilB-like protein